MTQSEIKENCRLFYMVKGHLNTSLDTINKCAPGYFKRLWHNEEAYLYETNFERHYKRFILQQQKQLGKQIAVHVFNKLS